MTDTIPYQLKILFSTFPPPAGDVQDQIVAYGVALAGHNPADIESAVRKFIRGEVAGHNQSFTPTAPKLGAVVRECMNERLDSEHRERLRQPALPPPDIERSPEARERVRLLADATIKNLASVMLTEDAADSKRKAAFRQRGEDMFRPDMSPEAVRKRLGFTVGDPDGDEAAA